MNIIDIIKEEIEQFDWGKEKVADKPIRPNRIVYHISDPKFRASIAQNGLQTKVGDSYGDWVKGSGGNKAIPAIFATNSDLNSVTGGVSNFGGDVWAIDTTKINNQWYEDKHFSMYKDWGINNPNIVTFENISSNALSLAHKPIGILHEDYNHVNYLKWKRQNVTVRGVHNNVGTANSDDENLLTAFGDVLGKGLYTAFLSNKGMAKQYGKVYFVLNAIPKHPKVFNTLNDWQIWFGNTLVGDFTKQQGINYPNKRVFNAQTTIEKEMLKRGYDGVVIKGREMVNYTPPDNVLYFSNEHELMNYYENNIEN